MEQARFIIETIYQTGQFFGASHIIDVVRGASNAKIKEKQHDALAVFGKGATAPKVFIKH